MSQLTMLLVILFTFTNAMADENDLFGGTLNPHHPPDLVYSAGEDWCARYHDTYGVTSSAELNPRSDILSDNVTCDVWYVIAAWMDEKLWCGTQFGLGAYDSGAWYMTGSGNCLLNSLEIPTIGWPGPETGISIAATDTPYAGNFVPIYWFEGYTYSGEPVVIPLVEDPSQDFIGFGNCMAPAEVWPACGGAMGFFTDGVTCIEPPPPPMYACCDIFGGCVDLPVEVCIDDDGIPYFDEYCNGFTCPVLIQACCFPDGSCNELLPEECEQAGGYVFEEVSCDPNPCSLPPGACCFEDGQCLETVELDCDGDFWMIYIVCDPNPCGGVQPGTDDPSWGGIKRLYR
jgi:hypothetical protein